MMAARLLFTIQFEYTDQALLARVFTVGRNGSRDKWLETREYALETDRGVIVAAFIEEFRDRTPVYQPMIDIS